MALEYVPNRFKVDLQMRCFERDVNVFPFMTEDVRKDEYIYTKALNVNVKYIENVPFQYINENVWLMVMEKYPEFVYKKLCKIDKDLLSSYKRFAMAMLKNLNTSAHAHVKNTMPDDSGFWSMAIMEGIPGLLSKVPMCDRTETLSMKAIENDVTDIKYVDVKYLMPCSKCWSLIKKSTGKVKYLPQVIKFDVLLYGIREKYNDENK